MSEDVHQDAVADQEPTQPENATEQSLSSTVDAAEQTPSESAAQLATESSNSEQEDAEQPDSEQNDPQQAEGANEQATLDSSAKETVPHEASAASDSTTSDSKESEDATAQQTEANRQEAERQETERKEAEAKSQREILAEELQNLTQKASPSSLLFFAPNLEEIAEQARAEREARREALEAERRQRRLAELTHDEEEVVLRRRRRRRRGEQDIEIDGGTEDDPENTVTKIRTPRISDSHGGDHVTGVRGSTRLEAKKIRRRESRHSGRRQRGISEAEFLARRESVDRQMVVRQKDNRIQIGVLEDGVLAEHFVSKTQQDSLIGNVYLGKVQNVLPSMEAAFVDIGRGRNAVLYAGEVNWDVSGLDGSPRKIENALKPGDSVLVQVTKDPVGHKGARLTSQVSLPGRFLVFVPGGSMTGISRKLPDNERLRLKKILKDKMPQDAGVIVRTAAEGASEQELSHDINRLRTQWEEIKQRAEAPKTLAPEMLYQEPDLTIKTVRDVFNEDFTSMTVQGPKAWDSIEAYVTYMAPDLVDRLHKWESEEDLFDHYRVEEQLQKALDRKVYLPSGGSLVIDRTEAMTVVDVNTGKFTGSGGNLEETVTKNNLEAAEEIVRQLRLRDIGGIIVIDFIDMVLESNRDLVLRRLIECLGRDRTKHQVAEVTSLGLVQMTRKRMGTGLLEVFSEPCEHCAGRGVIVHDQPLKGRSGGASDYIHRHDRYDRFDRRKARKSQRSRDYRAEDSAEQYRSEPDERSEARRTALANIAAASTHQSEAPEPQDHKESKNARKRKRRRQNRRENTEQNQPQNQRSESPITSGEPDAVLTIGGEVIELPHGERSEDSQNSAGEQGAFTLESLADVFEQKSEKKSSGRKSRREVKAEQFSQNSDASAEDTDVDSRFTQNTERFEAIKAGEARARASQKAGRDVARSEEESSENNGRSNQRQSSDSRQNAGGKRKSAGQKSADGADRSSQERDSKRRRPRRAFSAESAQPASEKKPLVTGVAQPGKSRAEQSEPVAQTKTSAQQVAPATKPKRRSRRAVSTGADGSVQTQQVEASKAAKTVVSTAAPQQAGAVEATAPVMLGVGVSAEQIKREGK